MGIILQQPQGDLLVSTCSAAWLHPQVTVVDAGGLLPMLQGGSSLPAAGVADRLVRCPPGDALGTPAEAAPAAAIPLPAAAVDAGQAAPPGDSQLSQLLIDQVGRKTVELPWRVESSDRPAGVAVLAIRRRMPGQKRKKEKELAAETGATLRRGPVAAATGGVCKRRPAQQV